MCALALEEPATKEKHMRRLMSQLPEPNYSTAMFILDHLIKYVTDISAAAACYVMSQVVVGTVCCQD